jgi:hypothetical protein
MQIRPTASVSSQDPRVAFLYVVDHAIDSVSCLFFEMLLAGGVCLVSDLVQAFQPVHPSPRSEPSWRSHSQLGFDETLTALANHAWTIVPEDF